MSEPVDVGYLRGMYASGEDPWRIDVGWYEQRKRELVLGCLPRERYDSAFEPGCAGGTLTRRLAGRAGRLLAADLSEVAVRTATERVADLEHVEVRQLLLPDEWPAGSFDLIVLSELGYFFAEPSWARLCAKVAGSLSPDATVLACHWRHEFAERTQSTAALHGCLAAALALPKQTTLVDADFLIDVWTASELSVAASEGLSG